MKKLEENSASQKKLLSLQNDFATFSSDAKQLELTSDSHTPFYYQVIQSGFDARSLEHEMKHGLEIIREYQELKGNAITEIPVGGEVEVHLKVRTLGQGNGYR